MLSAWKTCNSKGLWHLSIESSSEHEESQSRMTRSFPKRCDLIASTIRKKLAAPLAELGSGLCTLRELDFLFGHSPSQLGGPGGDKVLSLNIFLRSRVLCFVLFLHPIYSLLEKSVGVPFSRTRSRVPLWCLPSYCSECSLSSLLRSSTTSARAVESGQLFPEPCILLHQDLASSQLWWPLPSFLRHCLGFSVHSSSFSALFTVFPYLQPRPHLRCSDLDSSSSFFSYLAIRQAIQLA